MVSAAESGVVMRVMVLVDGQQGCVCVRVRLQ